MSNILIVGNSSAVLEQINLIKQAQPQATISVFCTESVLPYNRSLLPAWLAKQIKESQLYPEHDKFFTDHQVDVFAGEPLSRISVKRKYLTTDSKKQYSFDQLILIDTGFVKVPEIKGHHKQGVYNALTFSSVKLLQKTLIDIESIFIPVTSFQGLNMACALRMLGKEVTILSPLGLLTEVLDEEASSLLKQILEAKGIRIIEQEIEEILGDSEVKAVRLKSGKVIAAQAVVFDEIKIDTSMLSENELPQGSMRIEETLIQALSMPVSPVTFGLDLFKGYAIGITALPEGGREYLRFNGPDNIFKKIYAINDQLVGAVLYNAPELIKPITDIIVTKESIQGREEALISA